MTTAERARHLAALAANFPLLGPLTADDLLETVRLELGHAEALDGFRPHGNHFSRAEPVGPLLHIVSGNTPHAALQSLLRGLLLGAENWIKLPEAGLPEAEDFLRQVGDRGFAVRRVSGRAEAANLMARAGAVIAFGSDETIAALRNRVPAACVFDPHPHRVSMGIVFGDAASAAPRAARDVSQFCQKGCLSPHDIYVATDARAFAERLAGEMETYEHADPRGPITPHEAAEIAGVRANYRFRAASDPRVALWESGGSTAWTVIYEDDPWFATSCLNRVVFVKPLPDDLAAALGPARDWLAGIGIWPATPDHANRIAALKPSRICPLGRMQCPPFTWHQEGRAALASLVRWVDFEPEIG